MEDSADEHAHEEVELDPVADVVRGILLQDDGVVQALQVLGFLHFVGGHLILAVLDGDQLVFGRGRRQGSYPVDDRT